MFAFPPAPRPSLPIVGQTARFPVRRIFCVGRNYADHAREMGHAPDEAGPVFFTEPADTLVEDGATIPFPKACTNLHHEGELVVALGPDLQVFGHAIGNDLTRRDLQAEAKRLRRPWDMAKGFDHSAPCGPLHPATTPLQSGQLRVLVNGKLRQHTNLADMIWPVPEILVALAQLVDLCPGDLIFTGTPAGVGPLEPGDSCVVEIDGLGRLTTFVGPQDT